MSAKFEKRSTQPLRADSYPHAARRLRKLADQIEQPETRDRAITDLRHFARRLAVQHSGLYCEICQRMVPPTGDDACPKCGLVL